MVTNVSEKDKALQEVIAWCDSRFDKACQYFSNASSGELAARYLTAIYAYRGVKPKRGREKMKWKPDWMDIAENLLIGLMAVAAAAIFIVICVCVWKGVMTERTIIMRDGNQSYACSISDISPTPYDCKPIEDTEE